MNRFLIGFSYLLVVNFEMALFLISAVQGAKYLNRVKALSFDWLMVTIPISLLLCFYAIYKFLVFIVKSDQKGPG